MAMTSADFNFMQADLISNEIPDNKVKMNRTVRFKKKNTEEL